MHHKEVGQLLFCWSHTNKNIFTDPFKMSLSSFLKLFSVRLCTERNCIIGFICSYNFALYKLLLQEKIEKYCLFNENQYTCMIRFVYRTALTYTPSRSLDSAEIYIGCSVQKSEWHCNLVLIRPMKRFWIHFNIFYLFWLLLVTFFNFTKKTISN